MIIRYFILVLLPFTIISVKGQKPATFKDIEETLLIGKDTLYGSTMYPIQYDKKTIHVLIIAGSGPTDRNGNNQMMENNHLKKLAVALAENGIISTRYDKRGIAASKGAGGKEEDVRFDDMVNDAEAWLQKIARKKDKKYCAVIGHSEGSLIGMLAGQRAGFKRFVSLAGPGRPADVILKEQLANLPREPRQIAYEIIDSLKAGYTVQDIPPAFMSLFRPSVQPYSISWMKYNPAEEIRKFTGSVMIVQGTSDLQVTTEDSELLKAARPDAEYLIVEDMNHILVTCTGGRDENTGTYNEPTLPLSDGFVEKIAVFLKIPQDK